MKLKKITHGFVTQTFNTETQQWEGQEFTAGDPVDYETEDGDPINSTDFEARVVGNNSYLPFEMKQPNEI